MEQDLFDLLIADHRSIEWLFAEIETAGDLVTRRRALDEVIIELARHTVAEETYLYPVMRASLPAGDHLAAHEVGEHAEADELMDRLTSLNDGDPEFGTLLGALMSEVREHLQEEETELFPRLRQACGHRELAELADQLHADRSARSHEDAEESARSHEDAEESVRFA